MAQTFLEALDDLAKTVGKYQQSHNKFANEKHRNYLKKLKLLQQKSFSFLWRSLI